MTIHKVGRKRIPVRVIINHEEETIWSIPVTKGEHHELETLYDFKAVSEFSSFFFSLIVYSFCYNSGNCNLSGRRRQDLLRRTVGRLEFWSSFEGRQGSIVARSVCPTASTDSIRRQFDGLWNLNKLIQFYLYLIQIYFRWNRLMNDWTPSARDERSICSSVILNNKPLKVFLFDFWKIV